MFIFTRSGFRTDARGTRRLSDPTCLLLWMQRWHKGARTVRRVTVPFGRHAFETGSKFLQNLRYACRTTATPIMARWGRHPRGRARQGLGQSQRIYLWIYLRR